MTGYEGMTCSPGHGSLLRQQNLSFLRLPHNVNNHRRLDTQNRVNEVSFGSFVLHLVTVIASLK
jgi:hypothetical protein